MLVKESIFIGPNFQKLRRPCKFGVRDFHKQLQKTWGDLSAGKVPSEQLDYEHWRGLPDWFDAICDMIGLPPSSPEKKIRAFKNAQNLWWRPR